MTLKQFFGNSRVLTSLVAVNIIVAALVGLSSLLSPALKYGLIEELVLPAEWSRFIMRPWTALTYMVTQLTFLHLLFNVLWLLWFGRVFLFCSTESRLLVTYIGGGLSGAILFLVVSALGGASAGSYLVGSSGAVLAVMTAAALMAPNLELQMLLIGRVRLKYVALLCIALTFVGIGGGNAGGLSAHFGGVLFGLFVPSLLFSRRSSREEIPSPFRKGADAVKVFINKRKERKVPEALSGGRVGERSRPVPTREEDEARLDQLLDKVRLSGYDSLTTIEKKELNSISNRL